MIHNTKYRILAIDTSCDETSAAVTEGTRILSSVVWSQASLHAKWGGVMPSLAQREHEKKIGFVVDKAVQSAKLKVQSVDAIAVTVGPGLAIALGVGIDKAKELAKKYNKPLISVNHLEGHLLSSLARPVNYKLQITNDKQISNNKSQSKQIIFPALGLVVSGGNTQLILIENIGQYKILAQTMDDALGEALDKGARMLGLGYPGGAILEKFAKVGDPNSYKLPVPMIGQEKLMKFSYSGLKTAFYRLIEQTTKNKGLNKKQIQDLAACYQDVAFKHLIRVVRYYLTSHQSLTSSLFLLGGGVGANTELRKRIRKMCREFKITPLFPYSKKLYGDNAAMIGVAAYFKSQRKEFAKDIEKVERTPSLIIDEI